MIFVIPNRFFAAAFIAAVLYGVPIALPFFSPGKWFLATRTDFRRQIRFVSGK
jgi:hypothetical protein